jgi:hypothetical protein
VFPVIRHLDVYPGDPKVGERANALPETSDPG